MGIDRKQLSKWLKINPVWNREKLSATIGVSMRTLYNWTSGSSPIPQKYQGILHALMNGENIHSPKILTDTLSITIDDDRYKKYASAAKKKGMDVKEWIVHVIDKAAEAHPSSSNPYSLPSPPPYHPPGHDNSYH